MFGLSKDHKILHYGYLGWLGEESKNTTSTKNLTLNRTPPSESFAVVAQLVSFEPKQY